MTLLLVSDATALGHVRACFGSWTPGVALLWVGGAYKTTTRQLQDNQMMLPEATLLVLGA